MKNIKIYKGKDRQGITSERFQRNSRTLSEVREVSSMKAKESQIGEQCQQENRFVPQILGEDEHPGESGSRLYYIKKGFWKACPSVPQTVGTGSQGCVSYGSAGERKGFLISRSWILPILRTEHLLSINFPHFTFGIATQFTGFVTSPFNMICQFKQENYNSGSNRNKGGHSGKLSVPPDQNDILMS